MRCPTSPPTGGEVRQAVPSTSPDGGSQWPAPILLPLSPRDSASRCLPTTLPHPAVTIPLEICSFCPSDLQSNEHLLYDLSVEKIESRNLD